MNDMYGGPEGRALALESLLQMFKSAGVARVFVKALSPNDNSKNQPYFGKDLSVLNMVPTGRVEESDSTSAKRRNESSEKKLTTSLNFEWMTADGEFHRAPDAKLILYPQYSEVRFSGFLKNSSIQMSKWMDPQKSGRSEGRFLILGVTRRRTVIGFLAVPDSLLARELKNAERLREIGVFFEISVEPSAGFDSRAVLLDELRRIHSLGWIQGKRLSAQSGVVACNNPNCGGYTLEAELGILPNGSAEPDFMGWEVKQYAVTAFSRSAGKPLTLMTPEPSGGIYKNSGPEVFIRTFGYPDKSGKEDRWNFGGVHRFGQRHSGTELELGLKGADPITGKFEPDGAVVLCDGKGVEAASWSFAKLLDHWKRKHSQAVYVPSVLKKESIREYWFGRDVKLAQGTDFMRLVRAIGTGTVYYDPGIKLVNASSTKPVTKRRSQFRIKVTQLEVLYDEFESVDLMA